MEIVIASQNLHKIREFRNILKPLNRYDFTSLLDYPDYTAPEETGETFLDNANLKAEHAAKTLNKWVIADDSGLVVPTLDGLPGVRSRRYASENATDAENRQKLLKALENFTDLQRSAYYVCCISLANPDGIYKSVTGSCEGFITEEERGNHGFGYDTIFCKHDYDKTFGELEERVKDRISHRYKAFEKLLGTLESLKL